MAGQTIVTRADKGSALTHTELDGNLLNGPFQRNSSTSGNGGRSSPGTSYYNISIPSGATKAYVSMTCRRGERSGGPLALRLNGSDRMTINAGNSASTHAAFCVDLTKGSVTRVTGDGVYAGYNVNTVFNSNTLNAKVNAIQMSVRHANNRGSTNASWRWDFS